VIGPALARTLAETFIAASFSGEPRHLERINKIDAIESRYSREE
jgi:ribose 5-phosphate isomerase RpiB